MLDLKAKLASAGLVSKEDLERIDRDEERKKARGKARRKAKSERRRGGGSGLPVGKLADKPKGEVYAAVRSWVDKVRLDAAGAPSDDARAFHFPRASGKIGRLMLEPGLVAQLQDGSAGLIAYMSNHGLAHAVVPAVGARAVAELFPLWLRVLEGDPRAGKIDKPDETDEPDEPTRPRKEHGEGGE